MGKSEKKETRNLGVNVGCDFGIMYGRFMVTLDIDSFFKKQ